MRNKIVCVHVATHVSTSVPYFDIKNPEWEQVLDEDEWTFLQEHALNGIEFEETRSPKDFAFKVYARLEISPKRYTEYLIKFS